MCAPASDEARHLGGAAALVDEAVALLGAGGGAPSRALGEALLIGGVTTMCTHALVAQAAARHWGAESCGDEHPAPGGGGGGDGGDDGGDDGDGGGAEAEAEAEAEDAARSAGRRRRRRRAARPAHTGRVVWRGRLERARELGSSRSIRGRACYRAEAALRASVGPVSGALDLHARQPRRGLPALEIRMRASQCCTPARGRDRDQRRSGPRTSNAAAKLRELAGLLRSVHWHDLAQHALGGDLDAVSADEIMRASAGCTTALHGGATRPCAGASFSSSASSARSGPRWACRRPARSTRRPHTGAVL